MIPFPFQAGGLGLVQQPSAGGAWSTAASFTPNASSGAGWNGYTIRSRIATSQIFATGTKVRVTVRSGPGGMVIGKCYIGLAAASGDSYDFASAPTQILFGGNPGVTVGASSSALSDEATFTIDDTTAIIISVYFSTSGDFAIRNAVAGWQYNYKAGDDAATVNASGYSGGGSDAFVFSLVEVQ